MLDNLKHLDINFIITEVISFINNKTASKPFQAQTSLLDANTSKDLLNSSQFLQVLKAPPDAINFCNHCVTVFITSSTLSSLEKSIEKFLDSLGELGVIAARHDIFLNSVFWSQLPGNFLSIPKRRVNLLINACAFTNLHSYYFGLLKGGINL